MKKLLLILSISLGLQTAYAQAWNGQGDQKIQAGINLWGKGNFGVKASYDYGIADAVSIGAGAGIYFNSDIDREDRNNAEFSIYGRANYHMHDLLNLPSQLDIYPGVTLGIIGDTFDFGAHVGVRYFFTDKVGAYAELGNRGGLGIVFNL
ncbi:DUF6646 family protein [Elizabethkingia sp. JS20170427COW]|uniref:DUF6646 family protein n=1 Tax=Elizabethkingia sp. JS20170427COW TaxID=2583851 RepID=UPI0011102C5A|nr:DUF6646 family protein [Elizabethkingia sp. JS20170427COW]QCX53136.1 hypothetical protein FGE20_05035 [Elizabethkingia sp. JS20170427COW]